MQVHALKCIQPYFDHVTSSVKTFEVRKNDCAYAIGDILVLREYNKEDELYMNGIYVCYITYIIHEFSDLLTSGTCVVGLSKGLFINTVE